MPILQLHSASCTGCLSFGNVSGRLCGLRAQNITHCAGHYILQNALVHGRPVQRALTLVRQEITQNILARLSYYAVQCLGSRALSHVNRRWSMRSRVYCPTLNYAHSLHTWIGLGTWFFQKKIPFFKQHFFHCNSKLYILLHLHGPCSEVPCGHFPFVK